MLAGRPLRPTTSRCPALLILATNHTWFFTKPARASSSSASGGPLQAAAAAGRQQVCCGGRLARYPIQPTAPWLPSIPASHRCWLCKCNREAGQASTVPAACRVGVHGQYPCVDVVQQGREDGPRCAQLIPARAGRWVAGWAGNGLGRGGEDSCTLQQGGPHHAEPALPSPLHHPPPRHSLHCRHSPSTHLTSRAAHLRTKCRRQTAHRHGSTA